MQYVLFNPQAGNGSGAQQARALDARFPEETFSYTDMTTISDYAGLARHAPGGCVPYHRGR